MRFVDKIILHCSDSDVEAHDNLETIEEWHKQRGFTECGYHFIIQKNGVIEMARPIEKIGAHCKGKNTGSIGICLCGAKEFTEAQFTSCRRLVKMLMQFTPKMEVFGHCDFSVKKYYCPGFDYMREVVNKL